MYYRFEARISYEGHTDEWLGIFQYMNPTERRAWSCLTEPKWYANNPDINTKAWFTEHGYQKWKDKMQNTINNFNFGMNKYYEFRLITTDNIPNMIKIGKTQVLQIL